MKTQQELEREIIGPEYYKERSPEINLRNREYQSSKEGKDANVSIGIRDIDEALFYYFNKVIKPTVNVQGVPTPVPVLYANPEKWVAVQRDGEYRDKNGKKQYPVIVFKRNSVSKDRKITSKVDANSPHNFYITGQKYSKRNAYGRFEVVNNVWPEIEYNVTVVPDFVDLEYSCTVFTDFVDQMNNIVEAITFASDSFWGDPNKFKFQTFIDSIKTEVTQNKGEDRGVKSDFNMKLKGYILPSTINSNAFRNLRIRNYQQCRIGISEGVTTVIPS